MGVVNICIHPKGGVGKSLVANLIAQVLIADSSFPLCLEAEVLCPCFSSSLPEWVKPVVPAGSRALRHRVITSDVKRELIERLCRNPLVVLDVGPSCYFEMDHWLLSPLILQTLKENGQRPVVHYIIKGGPELRPSIRGLQKLASRREEEPFDLTWWLNPYRDDVTLDDVPSELWHHKSNQIDMSISSDEVANEALLSMIRRGQTFQEALTDPRNGILDRVHLKKMRDEYAQALLGRSLKTKPVSVLGR